MMSSSSKSGGESVTSLSEGVTSSLLTEGGGEGEGVELLCVVRSLLKKIKRRVLVGDKVLVNVLNPGF